MAAFDELYATAGCATSIEPLEPKIEEIFIIFPPPCSFIMLATFWVRIHTPRTFTLNILSHPSRGNSSVGAPHVTPALFTSISILPNSFIAASTRLSISSLTPRSHLTARYFIPLASASFLPTSSQFSTFREAITRLAPASARPAAINSPIPRPPPVTIATFPLRLNISFTFIA